VSGTIKNFKSTARAIIEDIFGSYKTAALVFINLILSELFQFWNARQPLSLSVVTEIARINSNPDSLDLTTRPGLPGCKS
jgi:hypothetical protein